MNANQPKGDFYALNRRRRNARTTHVVRSLNKDGSVSKMHLSDHDRFSSEERALEAVRRREELNPGRRWIVEEA
jgi:hypothetical protein